MSSGALMAQQQERIYRERVSHYDRKIAREMHAHGLGIQQIAFELRMRVNLVRRALTDCDRTDED